MEAKSKPAAPSSDDQQEMAAYHAMILLGHLAVTEDMPAELVHLLDIGTLLWIIQNTWVLSAPVVLMTSEYLADTHAQVLFYPKDGRTLKESPHVEVNIAPIAEACSPQKADTAKWSSPSGGHLREIAPCPLSVAHR